MTRQRAEFLDISRPVTLKRRNVDHVDLVAAVLPLYMGAYVGRFLRGVFAVGTAESRQLPALELYVRIEIVLPAEDARAFRAGKSAPGLDLRARWHLEAAQMYQAHICKKTFENSSELRKGRGRRLSVAAVTHNGTERNRDIDLEQEKSQPSNYGNNVYYGNVSHTDWLDIQAE